MKVAGGRGTPRTPGTRGKLKPRPGWGAVNSTNTPSPHPLREQQGVTLPFPTQPLTS